MLPAHPASTHYLGQSASSEAFPTYDSAHQNSNGFTPRSLHWSNSSGSIAEGLHIANGEAWGNASRNGIPLNTNGSSASLNGSQGSYLHHQRDRSLSDMGPHSQATYRGLSLPPSDHSPQYSTEAYQHQAGTLYAVANEHQPITPLPPHFQFPTTTLRHSLPAQHPFQNQSPNAAISLETQPSLDGNAPPAPRSTLWFGDLEPWMDVEYFNQVCRMMGWENVVIKMPQVHSQLQGDSGHGPLQPNNPGYCFLTFPNQAHAMSVYSQLGQSAQPVTMPNSKRTFNVNWATLSTPIPPATLSNLPSKHSMEPAGYRAGSVGDSRNAEKERLGQASSAQFTGPGSLAVLNSFYPSSQNSNTPNPSPASRHQEYSIFVGDLAPETTNSDLIAVFRDPILGLRSDREPRFIRPFTSCKSAKIMVDPVLGVSKGYGFVRFSEEADQQRALIEMQGLYCLSRPMRISQATAKAKPQSFSVPNPNPASQAPSVQNFAGVPNQIHHARSSGSGGIMFYDDSANDMRRITSPAMSDPHPSAFAAAGSGWDAHVSSSHQSNHQPLVSPISSSSSSSRTPSLPFTSDGTIKTSSPQSGGQTATLSDLASFTEDRQTSPDHHASSFDERQTLPQSTATLPEYAKSPEAIPSAALAALSQLNLSPEVLAQILLLASSSGSQDNALPNNSQADMEHRGSVLSQPLGANGTHTPIRNQDPPRRDGSGNASPAIDGVLGSQTQRPGPLQTEQQRAEARALLASMIGPNGGVLNSTDPYNTTVFVGGLSGLISEDTLRSFFGPFGEIHYVKIPPGKGCGFVQFVRKADAERAIERMQGFPIGGGRVRLSWGRSQSDKAAQAAAQAAQLGLNLGQLGSLQGLSATHAAQLLQTLGFSPNGIPLPPPGFAGDKKSSPSLGGTFYPPNDVYGPQPVNDSYESRLRSTPSISEIYNVGNNKDRAITQLPPPIDHHTNSMMGLMPRSYTYPSFSPFGPEGLSSALTPSVSAGGHGNIIPSNNAMFSPPDIPEDDLIPITLQRPTLSQQHSKTFQNGFGSFGFFEGIPNQTNGSTRPNGFQAADILRSERSGSDSTSSTISSHHTPPSVATARNSDISQLTKNIESLSILPRRNASQPAVASNRVQQQVNRLPFDEPPFSVFGSSFRYPSAEDS